MGGVCAAAICVTTPPPPQRLGESHLPWKGPGLLVLPPSLTVSMPEEREMERERERKNFCNRTTCRPAPGEVQVLGS